jgi:hypothetical protein
LPKLFSEKEPIEDEEEKKQAQTTTEAYKSQVLNLFKEKFKSYKTSKWRNLSILLEVLPSCQDIFSLAECNEYFSLEIFDVLKYGNKEIQKTASHCLCSLLLKNYHLQTRKEVLGKILNLSQSPLFSDKIAYLSFVEAAVDHYSTKFLTEEGFIDKYISMAEDKVTNIKIRYLNIAGKMNPAINTEDSRNKFLDLVDNLQNASKPEVRRIAKNVFQQVKESKQDFGKAIDLQEIEDNRQKNEENLFVKEQEVFYNILNFKGRRSKKKAGRRK